MTVSKSRQPSDYEHVDYRIGIHHAPTAIRDNTHLININNPKSPSARYVVTSRITKHTEYFVSFRMMKKAHAEEEAATISIENFPAGSRRWVHSLQGFPNWNGDLSEADHRNWHRATAESCGTCGRSFKLLSRHAKAKHPETFQAQPKRFDCLMVNCDRKGDKAFSRSDNLRQHLRLVHNQQIPKRSGRSCKVGEPWTPEHLPEMDR